MGFTDRFTKTKDKAIGFVTNKSQDELQQERLHQKTVRDVERFSRREKEVELAKVHGYQRAEKGGFARQLGSKVLGEFSRPSAAGSAMNRPAEPHHNLTGRKPKYVRQQTASFAPASFGQPKAEPPRPFIVGGDESASSGGLSMGMEMAFSGQRIERKPTAIDRAFFGEKKKKSLL